MTSLFDRVVVPLANEADARSTCEAILPYVTTYRTEVVVLHVVEKAGGAPDKASDEQREEEANQIFNTVKAFFDDTRLLIGARLRYDTDIVEPIFEVAEEVDANSIMFTPRGANRWIKLLAGDIAYKMIHRADRPVIVVPPPGHQR